jgi:hypothetical protein
MPKHSYPIGSEVLWLLFGFGLVCVLIMALLWWILRDVQF